MKKNHPAITETALKAAIQQRDVLLRLAMFMLKGLKTGHIQSKPILSGMDDPEAESYELCSLEHHIEKELDKIGLRVVAKPEAKA